MPLVQLGGWQLDRPMELSWSRCRNENGALARGPCDTQQPGMLCLGGVIWGNFKIK